MQGPLLIWTEYSNCQIHIRGDSKTLIALLIPNIFLILFLWNYCSMHIKAKGMTQFDIFHVFVENSVNSELCCFWSLLQPAKIWNLSKNAHVWAAQKTSSNELKIFFDPLLERSWYELFGIIKAYGPKNQPPSSPRV